jgi:hypothetical protein
VNAQTAQHAATATTATTATRATTAGTADTATDAQSLGGKPAASYQRGCQPGSVAAVAAWYEPAVPADPTYVAANRYGGEETYACAGPGMTATKEGTGVLRVQVNDPALYNQGVVPVAIPDSRSSTPIYGHVSGPFGGGIYDVHTYDKTGTPVDAYYIGLELLQTQGG